MKVKLFAYLAEAIDNEITVALTEPVTKDSILETISKQLPAFSADIKTCNVAVNQAFLTEQDTYTLAAIDEVALIPPVSGG